MTLDHDRAHVLAEAEASCRLRGGRLTPGRRLVLEFLLDAARPLTAYEVMDKLRLAGAPSTPASAYRSLEFLMEQGLAHRLETTRAYVACGHPEHPHAGQFLICRQLRHGRRNRGRAGGDGDRTTWPPAGLCAGPAHGRVDRRVRALPGLRRRPPQNRCVSPARIARRNPYCGLPTPSPLPSRSWYLRSSTLITSSRNSVPRPSAQHGRVDLLHRRQIHSVVAAQRPPVRDVGRARPQPAADQQVRRQPQRRRPGPAPTYRPRLPTR